MSEPYPNIKAPSIHLLAIGNELLNGETRDTNLAWLIKRFAKHGGRILRANMVPDDFDAIADEIDMARNLNADLFLTTGGLGPTDDDATLAAIASALKLPLLLDPDALRMVKERLAIFAKRRSMKPPRMSNERKSMAFFPGGSSPIYNPVGVAPGMMLRSGNLNIISLPGVPSEMKGIVSISLTDYWHDLFRGAVYVKHNITIRGIPEADLAPFARRVNLKDPGIYIKSRLSSALKKESPDLANHNRHPFKIILHFSVLAESRDNGLHRIDALIDSLINDLKKHYNSPLEIDLNP